MKRPITWLGFTSLAIALGQYFLKRATRPLLPASPEDPEQAKRLLQKAAPLLRLPTSPERPPEVLPDGSGLRCRQTGERYPYQGGVLDLLPPSFAPTPAQRVLDTSLTSWAYERIRSSSFRMVGLPDFPEEVAAHQRHLGAQPGETVLDLACGHGNFTVEWAKRVGPQGLVLGLDISSEMLARAAWHVRRWGLSNVLLIRGDAQNMPLAKESLSRINCSGGFHQFPDLSRAIEEIARVSAPGAHLCASTVIEAPEDQLAALKRWLYKTVSLHFVPVRWLEETLATHGFADIQWFVPEGPRAQSRFFAYISARRAG